MVKMEIENKYTKLNHCTEYQLFKRKSRIRSLIGFLIMGIFSVMLLKDNNSGTSSTIMIVTGICLCGTFLMGYMLIMSLKKPKEVIDGQIIDIREIKRTGKDINDYSVTRLTHQYLVSDDQNKAWAECIIDYNHGKEIKHIIGEHVLCFSKNAGEYYIIKIND